MPRRTGTLLVYAGSMGLAATFLLCVYFHDVMAAVRGWSCKYAECTIPPAWSFEQTRDVFLLWFGGVRSVLQIRAGLRMQHEDIDRRGPLIAYLVVAALDCAALASLQEIPSWALVIAAGWPLFVFALTRTNSVRAHVWEPACLPPARLL